MSSDPALRSLHSETDWRANIVMNLTPKAVRFVVEALDDYVQDQDQRLRRAGASDDQLADWENDRQFIEAVKQDCLDQMTLPLEDAHVEA